MSDATPLRSITAEERQRYERDGVVRLAGLFSREWVEFLRAAVEEALRSPGPFAEAYPDADGEGRFFGDLELFWRLPSFRRFARESPAAEIAGRVMAADEVRFFYDQLLVKEPGAGARTPWHQDQPYWAVSGRQVCSVWLALDPVPREIAVEFVAGSHRWPSYSPYHFKDGSPYQGTGLPALPDIESERDRHTILTHAMEPGDCLVFQGMIVHGAPGNPGQHRRRAFATRWTGDDARFCRRPGEVAIPTVDPGLEHDVPLTGDRFPLVWSRVGGRHPGQREQ